MFDLTPYHGSKDLWKKNDFIEPYNLLDAFFNDSLSPFRWMGNESFKLDLRETDKEYLIDCELAGYDKNDIKVDYDEGRLNISASKENDKNDNENYIHRERSYSSMQRSIYLKNSSCENINAKFENGVLQIRVPKTDQPEKNTRIVIQ